MEINCKSCGTGLEVSSNLEGRAVKCKECNATVKIPITGKQINPGMKIGGFETLKPLGIGGMGEVWLAEQKAMDRKVALKILSPKYTNDTEFVGRFMSEVKFSAKLEHPNIVTAFDAGIENGIHYLAISFVEGMQLEQILFKQKIVPEKQALKYIRNIAEALDYAWENFQLLHRDIKPGNIMIDEKDNAKLMDMGLCKSINEDLHLTQTDVIIGTPFYMSPEQAMEKDIDTRSDEYSLGATLYHLLSGEKPFKGNSPADIIQKHIQEPLRNPQEINPDLSDDCVELLNIMMAKKVSERHNSWKELISDLDKVIDGAFLSENIKKEPKQKTPLTTAILIVIFVIIVALFAIFNSNKQEEKDAQIKALQEKLENTKKGDIK